MRWLSRAFRSVLLLSVLLNLGDAPYLDEIFDEHSQGQRQTVNASLIGSGTLDSSPDAPDSAKHAYSPHELLLHLYGIVHEERVLPRARGGSEQPSQKFLFVAFGLPERIDRPPQSGSLAV